MYEDTKYCRSNSRPKYHSASSLHKFAFSDLSLSPMARKDFSMLITHFSSLVILLTLCEIWTVMFPIGLRCLSKGKMLYIHQNALQMIAETRYQHLMTWILFRYKRRWLRSVARTSAVLYNEMSLKRKNAIHISKRIADDRRNSLSTFHDLNLVSIQAARVLVLLEHMLSCIRLSINIVEILLFDHRLGFRFAEWWDRKCWSQRHMRERRRDPLPSVESLCYENRVSSNSLSCTFSSYFFDLFYSRRWV